MPELCSFEGISIYMYSEPNSPHKLPHIHAEYQGQQIVVSLDGVILEGDLPSKKLRYLLVWMDMRKRRINAQLDCVVKWSKIYEDSTAQVR